MGEQLQIAFVPLNIQQNFCESQASAPQDCTDWVMEDSAFDCFMPDPSDRLPKGVGLGFKEFPKNDSKADLKNAEVLPFPEGPTLQADVGFCGFGIATSRKHGEASPKPGVGSIGLDSFPIASASPGKHQCDS